MSNGCNSIASGACSFAEGSNTRAVGFASHSEGAGTYAPGYASYSEGEGTEAGGTNSHAEGNNTIVNPLHTGAHIMGQNGTTRFEYSWHLANGLAVGPTLNSAVIQGATGNLYLDGTVFSPAMADYAEASRMRLHSVYRNGIFKKIFTWITGWR